MFMFQDGFGGCGCQNKYHQKFMFQDRFDCCGCGKQNFARRPQCFEPMPCCEPKREPMCRQNCFQNFCCCNDFDFDNDCFCGQRHRGQVTVVSGTNAVQTRLAEFFTATSTSVANGGIVPLTTQQFNNTNGAVSNANGTITLTQGLYKIDYSVIINAVTATDVTNSTFSIVANANGSQIAPATSTETISNGQYATVSNSFVLQVANGQTTTVTFNLQSTNSANLIGNVVIQKVN